MGLLGSRTLRLPLIGGGDVEVPVGTLAQLQAKGLGEVSVGDLGIRTDTRGRRLLECLTSVEGSSSWGYKEEFWLSISNISSSASNAERYSCGPTSFTVGSSLATAGLGVQFFYPELYGADTLEIVPASGRYLRNSDPGATDINVYKNGNATAISSDTISPGANTEAPFDISGDVGAGEWLEFGFDPTNIRVTWEKTYAFVKAIKTFTVAA